MLRALLLAVLAVAPLAGAAPGVAGVAAGFAHSNTCAQDHFVVIEYDALAGSATARSTTDPVHCGSHYWVWRPGLCTTDDQLVFRCTDYYPVTVAGVTTLYFRQWLNLTLEPDGDMRLTLEFEQGPPRNKVLEGRLIVV